MKAEKISNALNKIGEDLLTEANELRAGKKRWNIRPFITLAAAAAVILAGIFILPGILKPDEETGPAGSSSYEETLSESDPETVSSSLREETEESIETKETKEPRAVRTKTELSESYYALVDQFFQHEDELLIKRFPLREGENSVKFLTTEDLSNLTFYLNCLSWIETESLVFYEASAEEVQPDDMALVLTYEGSPGQLIMYEKSDLLQVRTEEEDRYYYVYDPYKSEPGALPVYGFLRNIYDDAEEREAWQQAGVFDPIPDRGQTYVEAAYERFERRKEAMRLIDPGSKAYLSYETFLITPINDRYEPLEDIAGVDAGAFQVTFIWKAETERAFRARVAGANIPYEEYIEKSGETPDPAVPEGAYIGTVFGRATKNEDGWHVEIIGTALD